MKNLLSTTILFLTLGFGYSQVTETFDGVTISGDSFTTNSGLSFATSDTFESWLTNESNTKTELINGGVTLTAPIPHVYLDQSGSYFEFTPTSADKWLSSLSFDLWYSNSESGTTLACECKSYDSSGNLLETITKDVIAKTYNFSGTPKKIRCNITEINSQNAVFFDDITFTLVDQAITNESNYDVFTLNSTNASGIESIFSNNSIGNYSFSVGIANTASGEHSSAFGQETNATGLSSLASGYDTTASGAYSSAFGQSTTASGSHSTAFGNLSTATAFTSFSAGSDSHANGAASIALGSGANAQNDYAVAIGNGATASAESSVALGYNVTASGVYSTAMGINSFANGQGSTAMGSGTIASDYASLAIGYFNDSGSTITSSNTFFDNSKTAFVIGNGVDNDNRSDALTVLFDGTTTIAGDLSINSDARLKANIISLGSTLAKLLQIDGKRYSMKKDENKKQKIGLLAQDIEKVFPELVSESNGIKSVNYQGLVPVLINALKEQNVLMKEQQQILLKQQSDLDELKSMMQKLLKGSN